ncbi:hypothetical protein B0T22DRAFT_281439 [Podospora appendiculata]|uniref:Secreted protein n=1 Tax=Podospora appendiculata TaxID=314037 RepID=A0AAE0X0V9_9PEZI|nr:hypothetical protein B0T22DRAFT_281439 [Podospora appendiculata]
MWTGSRLLLVLAIFLTNLPMRSYILDCSTPSAHHPPQHKFHGFKVWAVPVALSCLPVLTIPGGRPAAPGPPRRSLLGTLALHSNFLGFGLPGLATFTRRTPRVPIPRRLRHPSKLHEKSPS